LETWLGIELEAPFCGRILPIDGGIAKRWGLLAGEARRAGRTLPVIDGLLVATVLHYDLTIVFRNVSDFSNTRAAVLNPWHA